MPDPAGPQPLQRLLRPDRIFEARNVARARRLRLSRPHHPIEHPPHRLRPPRQLRLQFLAPTDTQRAREPFQRRIILGQRVRLRLLLDLEPVLDRAKKSIPRVQRIDLLHRQQLELAQPSSASSVLPSCRNA